MTENGIAVVEETTAPQIVPQQEEQFDLVDVDGAAAYMNNYQEAIKALLTPEDYQTIANKDFKKKSAWRKLATAFRISDKVVDEQLEFDDNNQIVRARYRVCCTLPNGRSAEGVGVCSIFDKIRYKETKGFVADTETPSNFVLRGRFSNAEHDIPSTAHTRAKNRAIADLIGAGDVSAEEIGDNFEDNEVSNNDSSPKKSNKDKTSTPKRRARRKASRPKKTEDDVIETKAEVVEDKTSTKSDFKALADKNPNIKKAVLRLEDAYEEITTSSIIDELFDLYNIGQISEEQYFEAKSDLGL